MFSSPPDLAFFHWYFHSILAISVIFCSFSHINNKVTSWKMQFAKQKKNSHKTIVKNISCRTCLTFLFQKKNIEIVNWCKQAQLCDFFLLVWYLIQNNGWLLFGANSKTGRRISGREWINKKWPRCCLRIAYDVGWRIQPRIPNIFGRKYDRTWSKQLSNLYSICFSEFAKII